MRHESNLGDEGSPLQNYQWDPVSIIQFYDTFERSAHLEPEKRLMLAILDDALTCFQKFLPRPNAKTTKLFSEAEAWFWDTDSEDIFRFENVCAVLGLSPGYIRRLLTRWKAGARAKAGARDLVTHRPKKLPKRLRFAA